MGRRLRSHVHVHDDHGASHVFAPGDDVPEWAAERITNPKAWADDEPVTPTAEPEADDVDVSEPPRSGPGSGEAAWAEYAAARGLEVPDGASRKDIIAAVDAANAEQ
jgi:hypothetical protein